MADTRGGGGASHPPSYTLNIPSIVPAKCPPLVQTSSKGNLLLIQCYYRKKPNSSKLVSPSERHAQPKLHNFKNARHREAKTYKSIFMCIYDDFK